MPTVLLAARNSWLMLPAKSGLIVWMLLLFICDLWRQEATVVRWAGTGSNTRHSRRGNCSNDRRVKVKSHSWHIFHIILTRSQAGELLCYATRCCRHSIDLNGLLCHCSFVLLLQGRIKAAPVWAAFLWNPSSSARAGEKAAASRCRSSSPVQC